MATPITKGRVYILDSTVYNAGTPDLSLGTVGVDYCYITLPESMQDQASINPKILPLFGGSGIIIKNGKSKMYKLVFEGYVQTIAETEYIKRYFQLHAESGSNDDYCFWTTTSATTYWTLYDDGDNKLNGAPGAFTKRSFGWSDEESGIFKVKIEFTVVQS